MDWRWNRIKATACELERMAMRSAEDGSQSKDKVVEDYVSEPDAE